MEVRKGYKQTEIGVIPEDWEVFTLEKLSSRIGDGIHSTPKYSDNSDYFFVNGNNLKEGKIVISADTKMVSEDEYNIQKRGLDNSTLLLSINGTIGNIAYYNNENIVLGKSAAYINVNNKLEKRLLFQIIQTKFIDEYFDNELTGSTIKNLGLGSIRNTPIPLPPTKSEQTAIATALSDADALITSLEKLIKTKRAIKQGAMQELFSGKKRLFGYSDSWIEKSFPEMCWFQEGPGLRNWQFTNDGIKVINVTNLENGYLNLDRTARYISWAEFDKMYKHFEIDDNDIVVASSGNSYAKVAVVRSQDLPLVMNTSVIRFKPLKNLDYHFLLMFLKSNYFKDQIDLLITGGAQPNFGPFHLRKIKINVPPTIEEQSDIAQILLDIDLEIETLEQKLAKYKQIKQGMMQELLTGRIRLVENV
ncbi:MAG TPA: restriction endonuclease subunit S [Prolixibacteraceae bacterium]|nr:restriction endonuclease subunit S [Prolixibacteraceae bacterium]